MTEAESVLTRNTKGSRDERDSEEEAGLFSFAKEQEWRGSGWGGGEAGLGFVWFLPVFLQFLA